MKDEALKLALEALESCDFVYTFGNGGYQQFDRALVDTAITSIKQALAAQQEHEPENEPHVSLASVREDWGPGPHEYHSLPSQPAPVQPVKPSLWEQYHAAQPAPVQEPVAKKTGIGLVTSNGWDSLPVGTLFYTTPPAAKRQWVGLTDGEMYLNCPNWLSQEQCKVWVAQIEAKLKEKNT
jgi:hypothetical protein